jgi:hypothetical protein
MLLRCLSFVCLAFLTLLPSCAPQKPLGFSADRTTGSSLSTGGQSGASYSSRASYGHTSVQCSAHTKKGYRCQRMTTSANGRCYQHGG